MLRLFDEEAERRAKGKGAIRTKVLAYQTGLAYGYIANIISRRRREYERRVEVSRGASR